MPVCLQKNASAISAAPAATLPWPSAADRDQRGGGDPEEAEDRDDAPEQVRDPERAAEQREQGRIQRRVEIRDEVDAGRHVDALALTDAQRVLQQLSLIHISEPTRLLSISY